MSTDNEQPGRYACIVAGIVDNVIVATPAFVASISPAALCADAVVCVDSIPAVAIGWAYDALTGTFTEAASASDP